ncbi:MAG TPA: hypothetical protein DCX41_12160 [Aequorivita sp.]|nr:hypothetical protein [Aequorivita sp.]
MSEVRIDCKKFNTTKHFASWLRLVPNNTISDGKVLLSRMPNGSNRSR